MSFIPEHYCTKVSSLTLPKLTPPDIYKRIDMKSMVSSGNAILHSITPADYPQWPIENYFDDDPNTLGHLNAGTNWLTIEFPSLQRVNKFEFLSRPDWFGADNRLSAFYVEASFDNIAWSTVMSMPGGNPVAQTLYVGYSDMLIPFKYIRIRSTQYLDVAEIRLYEKIDNHIKMGDLSTSISWDRQNVYSAGYEPQNWFSGYKYVNMQTYDIPSIQAPGVMGHLGGQAGAIIFTLPYAQSVSKVFLINQPAYSNQDTRVDNISFQGTADGVTWIEIFNTGEYPKTPGSIEGASKTFYSNTTKKFNKLRFIKETTPNYMDFCNIEIYDY